MQNTQNQQSKNEDRSRVERMGDRIEQVYDELELKAHLGRMDLERALAQARPEVEKITAQAEDLVGDARDEIRLKLSRLDARIEDLERRYLRV